ncbi:GGDEF domain-containing protein [Xylophilus sp. GW821-FHT01B05]
MGGAESRHFRPVRRAEPQEVRDPLTGLYLREHWEWLLQANFELTRSTGGTATLVAAELDHLRAVQDLRGQAATDQALRTFGHLLRTRLRSTDIRGCRGSGRFGILLPDTDLEGGRCAVERLHWMLDARPLLAGERLTVSFGVCAIGPDMEGIQSWLQRADELLQQARRSGGDCVRA